MGTLYLVATPIGNLEDISNRALRILGRVSLIAAEDTRQTRKLLSHYDIHTPLTSYHEHNKLVKLDSILSALAQGDIALVSDAGTPALNDPGYELVQAALHSGFSVSPIPGPSAPLAALVVSGLPTETFLYLGYLPRKAAERRQGLAKVAMLPYTLIFLETPHRLLPALEDLQITLGDRTAAVARELTKLHEEIFRGKLTAAHAYFTINPPRGEITLVVEGFRASVESERWSEERLQEAILRQLSIGQPAAQIAAQVAQESGWPRREVYRMITGSTKPA
jgi:16S rRNA (cytidine1402-2'-O)-methyltransferase